VRRGRALLRVEFRKDFVDGLPCVEHCRDLVPPCAIAALLPPRARLFILTHRRQEVKPGCHADLSRQGLTTIAQRF
jgi:hypothetical protein